MKILIVADKFKGSLTSTEVAAAIETGFSAAADQLDLATPSFHSIPASDGGDGFLAAMHRALAGQERPTQWRTTATVDPLGRPIEADDLFDTTHHVAYIELARASGLVLLETFEQDPELTSTAGTGKQIRAAIEAGAKRIFVGLGGSATNDGGVGIAHELGVRFHDEQGSVLESPVGGVLDQVASIDLGDRMALPPIVAVNDVTNPLTGTEGAAHVYGPQKGADKAAVERLDRGLNNLANVVRRCESLKHLDAELALQPGTGAAGGVGFGLAAFGDAMFVSGVELLFDVMELTQVVESGQVDLIVTGEGKIDLQTADGKLVAGVATLAKKNRIPVIAFCGTSDLSFSQAHAIGLDDLIWIHEPDQRTVEESIQQSAPLLTKASEAWFLKAHSADRTDR